MKVFLTGATGSIGGSVLSTLLSHGHSVTCTVKDSKAHQALLASHPNEPRLAIVTMYLTANSGQELVTAAKDHDCIIHAAWSMEDAQGVEMACLRAFVEAGKATAETGRPCHLIATSGAGTIGSTPNDADETASTDNPIPFAAFRVSMEQFVLNSSAGSFTSAIVRPVWVYGGSYVDTYITTVKSTHQIILPENDGLITFIHKNDLAELYRLIAEHRASGVYHGCEPGHYSTSDIVSMLQPFCEGREPVRTSNIQEHLPSYGFFLFGLAWPSIRPIARRSLDLGWSPRFSFPTSFPALYGSS